MASSLATAQDVEDVWRPLAPDEIDRVNRLCFKASALLRQRVPWIDSRISRFAVNPSDEGGVDPVTAATVVATMVKRFLSNPDGASSVSETTGPYSRATSYALRGEKDVRGELLVTDADIEALAPPSLRQTRAGTIRVRPLLAPQSGYDLRSGYDIPTRSTR